MKNLEIKKYVMLFTKFINSFHIYMNIQHNSFSIEKVLRI
jgi:hypothetical protein